MNSSANSTGRVPRPLQVYLDSSDFSAFGEVLEGTAPKQHEEIFTRMTELARSGDVDFRYSYAHVSEAAPLTPEALPYAQSRAKAILAICGKRVLEPYFRLPLFDFMGGQEEPRGKPVDRKRFNGRRDDGMWIPGMVKIFEEVQQEFAGVLGDPGNLVDLGAKDMPLNRRLRRQLKRSARTTSLRNNLLATFDDAWNEMKPTLERKFPLSPPTATEWKRLLLGKTSANVVSDLIAADLANLPFFMQWAVPGTESALGDLPVWIREPGERFAEFLGTQFEMQQLLRSRYREEDPSVAKGTMELWREHDEGLRRSFLQQMVTFARSQMEEERHFLQECGFPLSESADPSGFASSQVSVALFAAYMAKHTKPTETTRKPEKAASDFGDLSHGCYIPYVDIIRADGFANEYFKNAADLFATSVVPKLDRLLDAITERLATQ